MRKQPSAVPMGLIFSLLAAPVAAGQMRTVGRADPDVKGMPGQHKLYDSMAAEIARTARPSPPAAKPVPAPALPTAGTAEPSTPAEMLAAMQYQTLPFAAETIEAEAQIIQGEFKAAHKLNAKIRADIQQARQRAYGITAKWLYGRLLDSGGFLSPRARLDRVEDIQSYYAMTGGSLPPDVVANLGMIIVGTYREMKKALTTDPASIGQTNAVVEEFEKRCHPPNAGQVKRDEFGEIRWLFAGPACS